MGLCLQENCGWTPDLEQQNVPEGGRNHQWIAFPHGYNLENRVLQSASEFNGWELRDTIKLTLIMHPFKSIKFIQALFLRLIN